MAKLTGGSLAIDSPRETEASGEDEAGGVADAAGPRRFRAKKIRPAPPSAPSAPGSGWVRRRQFRPEPVKKGPLGA